MKHLSKNNPGEEDLKKEAYRASLSTGITRKALPISMGINAALVAVTALDDVSLGFTVLAAELAYQIVYNRGLFGLKKWRDAAETLVERHWPAIEREWPKPAREITELFAAGAVQNYKPSMENFPDRLRSEFTATAIEAGVRSTVLQPGYDIYKRIRGRSSPPGPKR